MPARLAVLINAESRRNRRGAGRHLAAVADADDVLLLERSAGQESGPLLAEALAAGVRVLAVDGGDGTVMRVLTALADLAPVAHWPALALLPGGSSNVTAADLGLPRRDVATLRALRALARGEEGNLTVVGAPLLSVAGGGLRRPLRGFLWGAAGACDLVREWERRCRRRGLVGHLSHLLMLAWTAARLALLGPEGTGLAAVRCRPALDGEDWGEGRRLLLVATTLRRLVLGARPWWNRDGRPLALTVVPAPPTAALRLLPRLLAGDDRPPPRLPGGWRSGGGHRATIAGLAEFVLDGELFAADPRTPLEITGEETVRLVRPRSTVGASGFAARPGGR